MKITFIGHAALLVEAASVSILCDPVLVDPFCEGLNATHPKRAMVVDDMPNIDAIFLSHRHLDHFDVRSLRALRRDVEVFIPDDSLLEVILHDMGFRSVKRLRDLEELRFGSTSVVATPSLNRVPELGLAISDGQNTFWNQVDTVSTKDTIRAVKERIGEIDYLVAPWQPFLETSWHLCGDGRFPFHLYELLLREIELVNAHFVTPGANGLKFIGKAATLNHVAFPVTQGRFTKDISTVQPPPPTVVLTKPGDVVTLEDNNVRLRTDAATWVRTVPEGEDHTLIFCPAALGGAFENALARPTGQSVQKSQWKQFLQLLANQNSAHFAPLAAWNVVYQLVIEEGGRLNPFWFDFGSTSPQWQPGWTSLRSYTGFISSSLLDSLVTGRVSLSYAVTSGEYRTVDAVYRYRNGRIERPEESDHFCDPLVTAFSGSSESLLEAAMRAELATTSGGGEIV